MELAPDLRLVAPQPFTLSCTTLLSHLAPPLRRHREGPPQGSRRRRRRGEPEAGLDCARHRPALMRPCTPRCEAVAAGTRASILAEVTVPSLLRMHHRLLLPYEPLRRRGAWRQPQRPAQASAQSLAHSQPGRQSLAALYSDQIIKHLSPYSARGRLVRYGRIAASSCWFLARNLTLAPHRRQAAGASSFVAP